MAALTVKRQVAEGQCRVDVGFWGGVVPGNEGHLGALHAAGVLGFKCFLSDSGTADFPPVLPAQMEAALAATGALGVPLLVHAETEDLKVHWPAGPQLSCLPGVKAPQDGKRGRHPDHRRSPPDRRPCPRRAPVELRRAGMIATARGDGVAVTAETCPHYLALRAEHVPNGATTFKCSPPVREAANQALLWTALGDGVLQMVVSDHSPCPEEMKHLESGDFASAWSGISSLQLGLPVVWTEARRRGHRLADVVGWMATGPARLAGLAAKGRIAVGLDADLCVFAPGEPFVVDPAVLRHRHRLTPYAGFRLTGIVRRTMLRGRWIQPDGPPRGRLLVGGRR